MQIRGTTSVTCPACGTKRECELVQSINARTHPEAKQKLLAGDLNVLDCACGKRTLLAATLLYHDPDRELYIQVVPGGAKAIEEAAAAFAVAGASGTQRIVPTQNALIEKVKIADADLVDWAIELNKVLLVASLGELDRVLLFDGREGDLIHWILFDEEGRAPERVSSPIASYVRLAEREQSAPKPADLQIDRAWAVAAAQALITASN